MKLSNITWALALFSILLFSCNKKTVQQLQSTSTKKFDYFIGKGKIKFTDENDKKQSATLQLKMQKDSVVWGNINKSVVQVARFSVLNDSIHLLDKLSRKYYPKSANSLIQGMNIEFTEPMVENLLLGNLILPLDENSKVKKSKIIQTVDNYKIVSEFSKESKKITKVLITETNTVNKIEITYENYQVLEKVIYPKKTTIKGQVLKTKLIKTSVSIELSKVTTPSTKPSFPFKVPSSYEKL